MAEARSIAQVKSTIPRGAGRGSLLSSDLAAPGSFSAAEIREQLDTVIRRIWETGAARVSLDRLERRGREHCEEMCRCGAEEQEKRV